MSFSGHKSKVASRSKKYVIPTYPPPPHPTGVDRVVVLDPFNILPAEESFTAEEFLAVAEGLEERRTERHRKEVEDPELAEEELEAEIGFESKRLLDTMISTMVKQEQATRWRQGRRPSGRRRRGR